MVNLLLTQHRNKQEAKAICKELLARMIAKPFCRWRGVYVIAYRVQHHQLYPDIFIPDSHLSDSASIIQRWDHGVSYVVGGGQHATAARAIPLKAPTGCWKSERPLTSKVRELR